LDKTQDDGLTETGKEGTGIHHDQPGNTSG